MCNPAGNFVRWRAETEEKTHWHSARTLNDSSLQVAVYVQNANVTIHDAQTGDEVLALRASNIYRNTSVAFSPDGKQLAWGGMVYGSPTEVGSVKVWDAVNGDNLFTFDGQVGGVWS